MDDKILTPKRPGKSACRSLSQREKNRMEQRETQDFNCLINNNTHSLTCLTFPRALVRDILDPVLLSLA